MCLKSMTSALFYNETLINGEHLHGVLVVCRPDTASTLFRASEEIAQGMVYLATKSFIHRVRQI
jgi:hypothetical protein